MKRFKKNIKDFTHKDKIMKLVLNVILLYLIYSMNNILINLTFIFFHWFYLNNFNINYSWLISIIILLITNNFNNNNDFNNNNNIDKNT